MARQKKCPQCAEMVKPDAAICRFCEHQFPPEAIGKPPMSKGKGCLIAVGVFFGLTVVASVVGGVIQTSDLGNAAGNEALADGNAVDAEAALKSKKESRDNVAMSAGRVLKQAVRNPDSLVIESGLASDDGKLVCIVYRAQNGFGGMNREYLAFSNSKPHEHDGYWNKHCRDAILNDVTVAVKYGAGL